MFVSLAICLSFRKSVRCRSVGRQCCRAFEPLCRHVQVALPDDPYHCVFLLCVWVGGVCVGGRERRGGEEGGEDDASRSVSAPGIVFFFFLMLLGCFPVSSRLGCGFPANLCGAWTDRMSMRVSTMELFQRVLSTHSGLQPCSPKKLCVLLEKNVVCVAVPPSLSLPLSLWIRPSPRKKSMSHGQRSADYEAQVSPRMSIPPKTAVCHHHHMTTPSGRAAEARRRQSALRFGVRFAEVRCVTSTISS